MGRRMSALTHVPRAPTGHNEVQLAKNQTNQARRVKPQQVTDIAEVDRYLLPQSFRRFVTDAFEVVEGGDSYAAGVRSGEFPARFVAGWHVDAICDHLQAVSYGHIKRLIINVPPGTMKSMLCSVLWPAWMWSRESTNPAFSFANEKHRMLFSSYAEDFTKRDTRKSRALIESEWYRDRFPHVVLKSHPDTMMEFHNTSGGERQGASTDSGVTGKHVHGIVEDDPLKMQDAPSKHARDVVWEYRTQGLGFRLLPEAGWRVLTMQRLHEDDPSGRILKMRDESDPDEYMHLMLPLEFETKRRCKTALPFVDPRKSEGELLWPARMDRKFVDEKKSPTKGLGEYGYAGQAQQRPAPAEGGLIKRAWLQRYTVMPVSFDLIWQSWDLALGSDKKNNTTQDPWAGGWFGSRGSDVYLLPTKILPGPGRSKVTTFPIVVRAMKQAYDEMNITMRCDGILVENKASGKPAKDTLAEQKVPGIVMWNPIGDKAVRVVACSPFIEAGNFYVPDEALDPSIGAYVEELVSYPNASHDDQVDMTTQAILWWRKNHSSRGSIDLSGGERDAPHKIA